MKPDNLLATFTLESCSFKWSPGPAPVSLCFALLPQPTSLTSLSLCFFICRLGIKAIPISQGAAWARRVEGCAGLCRATQGPPRIILVSKLGSSFGGSFSLGLPKSRPGIDLKFLLAKISGGTVIYSRSSLARESLTLTLFLAKTSSLDRAAADCLADSPFSVQLPFLQNLR